MGFWVHLVIAAMVIAEGTRAAAIFECELKLV
jgi:hypothetical protein